MARVSDRDGRAGPVGVPPPAGEPERVTVNGVTSFRERHWSGKLTKPAPEAKAPEPGQGNQGTDQFSVDYPALVAFIKDTTFEGGARRTPGSVVLFVQDGSFTLCLTEKGTPELVAFQAARSPSEAFQAAEEGLRAGTLPWRSPRRSGGRR